MKDIRRRVDTAERRETGGSESVVSMFVDDLGDGRYRDTATGKVYEPGELPRGTILVLWENIAEVSK